MLLDFERSSCSCKKCRDACIRSPSYLIPQDMKPYMKETGFNIEETSSEEEIINWGKQSVLSSIFTFTLRNERLPVLIPKSDAKGVCVHFRNERCEVHSNSPYGCRMFSCKDSHEETIRREDFGIKTLLPLIACAKGEIPSELLTESERIYFLLLENCRLRTWVKDEIGTS